MAVSLAITLSTCFPSVPQPALSSPPSSPSILSRLAPDKTRQSGRCLHLPSCQPVYTTQLSNQRSRALGRDLPFGSPAVNLTARNRLDCARHQSTIAACLTTSAALGSLERLKSSKGTTGLTKNYLSSRALQSTSSLNGQSPGHFSVRHPVRRNSVSHHFGFTSSHSHSFAGPCSSSPRSF